MTDPVSTDSTLDAGAAASDNDDGGQLLIGSKGFRPGDDRSRVAAYQSRWRTPLDLLALTMVWLMVVPPGVITSDHEVYLALLGLRLGLSAIYAVDITIRSRLAPHHWYYLRHNPVSVASVFFPFIRVLFSLQLLRSIFQRGSIGKFALAAGLLFLNLTVVVYFFERHAPHANIKTLGNSLWWAVVTLTTVGYGDFYPVTPQGRVAAALLMFVGFAVLATVTAQISSSFIDQAARARSKKPTDTTSLPPGDSVTLETIAERLSAIEAQLSGPAPDP
jgi:voltage-gated potassium channel